MKRPKCLTSSAEIFGLVRRTPTPPVMSTALATAAFDCCLMTERALACLARIRATCKAYGARFFQKVPRAIVSKLIWNFRARRLVESRKGRGEGPAHRQPQAGIFWIRSCTQRWIGEGISYMTPAIADMFLLGASASKLSHQTMWSFNHRCKNVTYRHLSCSDLSVSMCFRCCLTI